MVSIYRLIILAVFLLNSISIIEAVPSVIHGLINGPETQISFSFPTDYISGNSITYPVRIHNDGSYNISLEIDHPISGVLIIGDWKMPLFIHPNDTISISLGFENDVYKPTISGKHFKEVELLNKIDNSRASSEDVTYAMASKGIDEYISWLTQRYNQYKAQYLSYRSQYNLSSEFEVYFNSELDYTYAFHLMRYRMEYPVANNLVPPLQLPSDYLEKINDVVINNTSAIGSPAYRRFLDEYINLSREINENDLLFLEEENFKVSSKTSPLFAQPDVPPIYQSVKQGEIVKFLGQRSDFKSKSRVGGEMSEDYWYKVKLSNGREGWLIGQTIDKIDKMTAQNEKPIKQEISINSKVVTKAKAIYEYLEVFNDPHERKVIRNLGYGYEMDYPHVSTTEDLSYKFQDIIRRGKFVMVDIDGEIGWVFEQGIKTEKKVIESTEQRQIVTLAALKDYTYLDRFLFGTPLYYFIASDLSNRIRFAKDDNLKKEIEYFLKISDNDYINRYIQYHYNETYGKELDFGLTSEDIQLVKLISTDNTDDIVTSSYTLDNDFQVVDNYVILPQNEELFNTYETRLSIADNRRIGIQVVSDPLSGSVTRLTGYNNESIAYDQTSNEMAMIQLGSTLRPLFLKAGADLSFDTNSYGDLLCNSDDKENTFLNEYYRTFQKRNQSIAERIRGASEIDFKTYVSSLAKQKITFLKIKKDQLGLDEPFVKDMTYDISYWLAFQLIRYTQDHPKFDKTWSHPKDKDDFFDFLSQIDINPVNRTLGNNYRRFIQSYFRYLHNQLEHRSKTSKELIEEKFNGYSYYYLQALELYADVFQGDHLRTGKEIAQFIQLNPYQALNRSLTNVYNANLPLRAGVAAPDFELKDRKGRLVSKAQLKGKIVVIDFWATWCAPCLEKMRTDRSLWNKYSSEDVMFLYVSLDNNKSAWQRFLNNNPSIEGLHAFPKDRQIAFDSSIAQAYKITSIPAFYIIGKDGNLAYNPFTTLTPARIRDHIDNLLYPR